MANQIEVIAKQIIEAAKITLEPNVSYEQRLAAYEFLEKTKDETAVAIPCGFFLSKCNHEPEVRHLGLQFLEDSIRYHWNDITVEQKVFIKDNSMALLANGTQDILEEPVYIKDKVSRLIVEMMKREWPQQWPDLLGELEMLANTGVTQSELVLMVFLRISEDVAVLQNLQSDRRRKDLYLTLTQNMNSLFTFFLNLLEAHFWKYKNESSEQSKRHCKVTQAVFATLTCFVEWIPLYCIQNHENKLFPALCQLISDINIRQNAAECFLQIVSRKGGKPEEKRFIIPIFSATVVESVFNAATLAVSDPLNETNYLFLKTLTQVVTTLGSQFCVLWGKEPDVKEPSCFPLYLNTLLAFTSHPSLTIFFQTNSLWTQLFKNDSARKSDALASVVPQWLPMAYSKMIKHGYPSTSNDVTSQYSSLDFDSEDEYNTFFCRVRTESALAIKSAAEIFPDVIFAFMKQQCQICLDFETSSGSASVSAVVKSWEALSHIVERVLLQVTDPKVNFNVPHTEIRLLLERCISYQSSDPELLSFVLSCISGLCVMLNHHLEIFDKILVKLFYYVTYTGGFSKENRPKSIVNLRMHAASLLIKLAISFPNLFLEVQQNIDSKVNVIMQDNDASRIEKGALMQFLLIINNQVNNYDVQRQYIEKITTRIKDEWLSLKDAFYSCSSLMEFIGLKVAPGCNQGQDELFGSNRGTIMMSVEILMALVNRCKPRFNEEQSRLGGFVFSTSEEGTVLRNPVTPTVCSFLPMVFCSFRALHGMFLDESIAQLHPYYAKVHLTSEDEKNTCLQRSQPTDVEARKSPYNRQQVFLRSSHDLMSHVLLQCGSCLGFEFYQYPQLADCLIHSVFWNVTCLTAPKMRNIIRILKPLAENCPKQFYETIIVSLVGHVAPIMSNELQLRWERVSLIQENDEADEDKNTDELVDTMLLHMLTREYLELIGSLLRESPKRESAKDKTNDGNNVKSEENEVEMKPLCVGRGLISSSGKTLLKSDFICQSLVVTLLRALSWPDTLSSSKSVEPLFLCVQEIMECQSQHLNDDAVKEIFTAVLRGIHVHGQHKQELENLLCLAVSLYERLINNFPILREVLIGLPGVQLPHLTHFEKLLANNSSKKGNKQNKFKKEAFQNVIVNIIGKSVGESFKKDVHFMNLNPIFKEKKKSKVMDEARDDLNLCSLFGSAVGH